MRIPPTLLALLAFSACATSATAAKIEGRDWRAQDVNGVPVTGDRPPTLRLQGKRATGNAGCNNFAGSYKLKSGRIEFGPVISTRMACDPAVMEQERRFISILAAARSFTRYGNGSLSLIAPDGRAIRFRPVR